MACLGIFFGGPTKSYFAHSAIVVMKILNNVISEKKIKIKIIIGRKLKITNLTKIILKK